MKIKLIVVVLVSFVLAACASEPLKAPCDAHGHNCGAKTKINQW